ncbi:glycoside hydrolase family 43 [Fusarium longipes]|uniref:Endo-1,5-alpha-L-arabinanase A n=1 Tax=Fusarium longipes TaxID=694270 RepID=A0A395T6D1_9HYPO|nr:glycoside hydrolase family 43 [Fusarium longipes]
MHFPSILTTCILALTPTSLAKPTSPHSNSTAGYVFAYFVGDDNNGESIFLAASNGNDALSWRELNGGKPILTSNKGTGGLRDPFLMRSRQGDKFFLIATDLKINDIGWEQALRFGSLYLEIWESTDLVHWSEQRHTLVSPPTAGMTWAPEAYYDESISEYVVYWASRLYAQDDPNHQVETYAKIMYATTKDFISFSEPIVWQDSNDRIDTTVLKDGDTYHRFTKDFSGVSGKECVDIVQESSTRLRDGQDGWKRVTSCIGTKAGLDVVEGPSIFKSNPGDVHGDKFYLFVDEFAGRGYIPLETTDIANPDWKVSENYSLPTSPRHGSVVSVTEKELQVVLDAYSN